MLWTWILLGLLAVLALFFIITIKMFRNTKKPHQKTPKHRNIPFEEIHFPTQNNRTLYGWWIPAKDGNGKMPTLILVHGWGRNVERMLPYIQSLYGNGFHMLAFDSRNHGSSDPDQFSSMIKFGEDIQAAIDYALTRPEVDPERIGVLGLSIGGAASIYAAAHDPRIKSAVTVGAFAHPGEVMHEGFRKGKIPYFPLVWLLFKYVEWRIGARLNDIAPMQQIKNTRAQILLVHGDKDTVVPIEQAKKLYAAADPQNVQLWIMPGRGHSDCHRHPEFWPRLKKFLDTTLKKKEG